MSNISHRARLEADKIIQGMTNRKPECEFDIGSMGGNCEDEREVYAAVMERVFQTVRSLKQPFGAGWSIETVAPSQSRFFAQGGVREETDSVRLKLDREVLQTMKRQIEGQGRGRGGKANADE